MLKLNEMIPGMRAKAEDINENFNMLLNEIKILQERVAYLESREEDMSLYE